MDSAHSIRSGGDGGDDDDDDDLGNVAATADDDDDDDGGDASSEGVVEAPAADDDDCFVSRLFPNPSIHPFIRLICLSTNHTRSNLNLDRLDHCSLHYRRCSHNWWIVSQQLLSGQSDPSLQIVTGAERRPCRQHGEDEVVMMMTMMMVVVYVMMMMMMVVVIYNDGRSF